MASVLLVDEATGVRRALVAHTPGNFEAAFLRSGPYRVEVGAPRFETFVRSGVALGAAGVRASRSAMAKGSRTGLASLLAVEGARHPPETPGAGYGV